MPYLVDGHNLVPKAGLRLDSLDDEMALVARLEEFCRLRRTRVEVYFDGAPPGFPALRKSGAVTAYFIRKGYTADAAIEARLTRLGKSARNWIVVSSDRRVQSAAHEAHATAVSAQEFARQMTVARNDQAVAARNETALSPDEVDKWLNEFERK